jgi:predicted small secreted protein
MRLFAVLAVLFTATLALSACNTINGVGKDLETAGKTIQDVN